MEALLAGACRASTGAPRDRRPADCSTSAIPWAAGALPRGDLRLGLAILAVVVGCSSLLAAQFAATTEVVEVYATVTDQKGQLAEGLTAEAFTVLEDGVEQPVSVFAAGEFPLTVAIVVDRSFSMAARGLDTARAGARRLADQLRARDRLMILAIGGGVETVSALDTPRESARQALEHVALWGSSPIGDTVVQAVDALGEQRGRRAVVLWSDGVEKEAKRDRAGVLDHVRRADVMIYPVAIAPSISPLLAELAALSGGRVLQARDPKRAESAAGEIALELRNQYLLGYAKPAGADGWRRIEVHVNRPGLRIRARQGYFARAAPANASVEARLASNHFECPVMRTRRRPIPLEEATSDRL
jgi:Ca-activated chloride channel homolog